METRNTKKNESGQLHLFVLAFALFSFLPSRAQDSARKSIPAFVSASLLYDFPKSYGLTVSAERSLLSMVKRKMHKNGTVRNREKVLFLSAEIGGYRYPYNYSAVYFSPAIGIRHYKKYFFSSVALHLGLLRTFYDGRVYQLTAAGDIKALPLYGRFFAVSGLSYAADWQALKRKSSRFYVQLKPSLWMQYPYDSFIKAHVSMEAGICYWFCSQSVNSRSKKS